MKLTALILGACLSVAARTDGQTITISAQNKPIKDVLTAIETQSGYSFIYEKDLIRTALPVSISVKNEPLSKVLELVFQQQPLAYKVSEKYIVLSQKTVALQPTVTPTIESEPPPIDVKGRVVNENGEPVAGTTVQVKGDKTKITSTNAYGYFELKGVEENATLIISAVNIETKEVKINGKTDLATISIKTKVTIGEAVVVEANTGYQTIRPNEVTGSFDVIDNKTINQQAGTNILKRLEGVTSSILFDTKSIQPQKKSNISIRGLSSINGSLDPLVVLDGFIYEGDINNINPNIIETITILKDAAAASIWGARAGNGVIVITSKKGTFNQKLQIDVTANVMLSSKPDLYYLPQMTSNDYINVEQILYNKGYFNSQFTSATRPALTPAVEIFRKRSLGQITATDSASQIDKLKTIDVRDEYNKHFYTNSITQQFAVNLRGGTSNNSYTMSVGYERNLSELYSNLNKLNIKIENTYRPVKNLQISASLYYTNSKNTTGKPRYNSIAINGRQPPYLKFTDELGNPMSVALNLRDIYTDTAGAGKLLNWKYYPVEDYKHDYTTNNLEEFFANFNLQYKIFKLLTFDVKYQYQKQQIEGIRVQDTKSYGARNVINLFSQLNRTTGIVKYIVPLGGVRTVNDNSIESQTTRAQLNYNHIFRTHHISSILGGEFRGANLLGSRITTYGYNEDPLIFGNVDFTTSYPRFTSGTQTIPGSPTYSENTSRFVSIYTNIAYTLKANYTFSFSARKDGSNIFGVNTNNKWKPLWSAGLGWKISNEAFYKLYFLPTLRLRATYGYSGNVDLSKSALPVARFLSADPSTGLPRARISTANDPELRWEKVGVLNIAIDFSFKKDVVKGTIEYYKKRGSDLYGPTSYDYTTWGLQPTITKNIASMSGNGFEINLTSKNIDKKFQWITNFIFNHQNNKTTQYFSTDANQVTQLFSGDRISAVINKPLYAIAAYKWGGLDSFGNPQGYVNGQLSTNYTEIRNEGNLKGVEGNIVYFGSALPTYFGSLINFFAWRNISISANLSYKLGYYFKKSSLSYESLINTGIGHKEYANRWQSPGDEVKTNVPSFIYPNISQRDAFYSNSEIHVFRADHVRLQYVNIGYSFLNGNNKRTPFQELQLYINAANLGILWGSNREKLDPEYPSALKPLRNLTFGIRVNF